MNKHPPKFVIQYIIVLEIILFVALTVLAYGVYYYYDLLTVEMIRIRGDLASTTIEVQPKISEWQSNLAGDTVLINAHTVTLNVNSNEIASINIGSGG
ncbi:MAG: hypothetical protein HYT47_02945 [Candidatus Vogelbacteria bacterium]|nr:hypothetical protein [Candidatus Vogelbacteria bacterium]